MIYFGVGLTMAELQNPNLPKVFTEGQKKTLALQRMSKEGKNKFAAVGLSGVWGWRGQIGKVLIENGKRENVKGVIPDFDLFNFQNCPVYICYDTNVQSNESVASARIGLARELNQRGAKVFLVELPSAEGVNGVDDLLAKYESEFDTLTAIELVWELFEEAQSFQDNKRESQTTILTNLIKAAKLFHTPDGETYATVKVRDHEETHKISSEGFREWLRYQFYLQEQKTPNDQALKEVIGTIKGLARFEGEEKEIHLRLANADGKIYFDLCNSTWQQVEINKYGWRVIEAADSSVKFRRTQGMLTVPTPIKNGDFSKLQDFINVQREKYALVLAWLVACFRTNSAFPILIVNGEQGSAKSTTCSVLRRLIDPNKADLRSTPREERDLIIMANNGWIIGLDNLSHIPDWLSDCLCRLSTGSGFSTRGLYTNDEEMIFKAKRPILINGIDELANRSDLLDRAIISKLPRISESKRKEETVFWEKFNENWASILGGLLDIVVCGLSDFDNVKLERLPRMADFAKWAKACEKGFPEGSKNFMEQYLENRNESHEIALEASSIASVIRRFADEVKVFEGKPTQFFEEVESYANEKEKNQKGFPKNSRSFGKQLIRIIPNLRAMGIEITEFKTNDKKHEKKYRLSIMRNLSPETSETSETITTSIKTASCASDTFETNSEIETSEKFQTSEQTSELNPLNSLRTSRLSDMSEVSEVSLPLISENKIRGWEAI